jgi:hypothetical protein
MPLPAIEWVVRHWPDLGLVVENVSRHHGRRADYPILHTAPPAICEARRCGRAELLAADGRGAPRRLIEEG